MHDRRYVYASSLSIPLVKKYALVKFRDLNTKTSFGKFKLRQTSIYWILLCKHLFSYITTRGKMLCEYFDGMWIPVITSVSPSTNWSL